MKTAPLSQYGKQRMKFLVTTEVTFPVRFFMEGGYSPTLRKLLKQ